MFFFLDNLKVLKEMKDTLTSFIFFFTFNLELDGY